jgi:hypothetical protein
MFRSRYPRQALNAKLQVNAACASKPSNFDAAPAHFAADRRLGRESFGGPPLGKMSADRLEWRLLLSGRAAIWLRYFP